MQMTKDDVNKAVKWPANAPAPLTREQQIHLMITARERHAAVIDRALQLLKEDGFGKKHN